MIDSILLNGTVGAGKTTTADALGRLSVATGYPHAVIDLDEIRRAWPAPDDDPFHHEVELANLASVVGNYRAVGVARFIVAGVVEAASEVPRYRAALRSTGLMMCRLTAPVEVLRARLEHRHRDDPDALDWYVSRVGELAGILDAANLDDLVIETPGISTDDLARRIALAAGWAVPESPTPR